MTARANRQVTRQSRAVVTGAGSGIGRAFALELAQRGGCVVCSDIQLERAQGTLDLLREIGADGIAVKTDVSQLEDVERLAQLSQDYFGEAPSLVVNNAGVGAGGAPIGVSSIEDWRWVLGVNLWGVIHGCHVFAPLLRAQGAGGIINVCSTASFSAAPGMGAYSTSKAGALALTETLAAELSGTDVAVTALCPTFVKTNIVKDGRIADHAQGIAGRLMDRWSITPERAVRETLRGLERRQLYIVPQLDARAIWRAKRWVPALYTRGAGRLNRLILDKAQGATS